jgi:CheY-like chemotaxis protein
MPTVWALRSGEGKMEHSSSELLSPVAELRQAHNLLLTMKDNPLAQEATESLAEVIPWFDSRPPRQPIRAVVDNTASESAGIDPGMKNNPPAQERTLQEVTAILAKVISDLNSNSPRQPMQAVVDDTQERTLQEVTAILAKVISDLHSRPPRQPMRAVVDNTARLQALPERDVPKDEVDAAKNHEPDHEAWARLIDLMKQAESAQASNLGQGLASAIASQFQALTQGRYDAVPLSTQLGTEGVVIGGAARPRSPTVINAGSRSALVIENDKSLLTVIKQLLKHEGYVVRSARDRAEGLRLYNHCKPFDVVLIDYYVPQTDGVKIDCFAPQKDGIELARAIRERNPSQRMAIAAFDYRHEDEVPRPTELKDIPVLVNALQLRELLEKRHCWATREEIDQAIAALSFAQWLKLQKFAKWRVCVLPRSTSYSWKDLLNEALLSTFIGAQGNSSGRRWNKRVDFLMHLTGAMRGISSQRKDKAGGREILECEAINCDAAGQELSPLDNLGPGDSPNERLRFAVTEGFQPAAERQLIAKEEVERMFRMCKDDKEATFVLEGGSEGMKKNEIMQKYELTAKQYDAATKRIRVKLLGPRNGGSGAEKHGR